MEAVQLTKEPPAKCLMCVRRHDGCRLGAGVRYGWRVLCARQFKGARHLRDAGHLAGTTPAGLTAWSRLDDERAAVKKDVLRQLLVSYADRLSDQYVVVTESRVRFAGRWGSSGD